MTSHSPPRRRAFIIEPNARNSIGHYYPYSMSIARAFAARGFGAHTLFHVAFEASGEDPRVQIHPTFDRHWAKADSVGPDLGRGKGFGYEALAALTALGANAADIAYVATIGCGEILEWLDLLERDGLVVAQIAPELHLMLRADPQIAIDNAYDYSARARRAFASPIVRDRVVLHADTDALAEQYSALFGLPVLTAPIPFDQTPLLAQLNTPRRTDARAPLHVVYLGDARAEKGFAAIPDAIDQVWRELVATGHMRFTLQANFNVAGGEEGVAAAKMRLAGAPESAVRLIHAPLSGDGYYALLAEADAVLIPYDARRYAQRSSGILVEAAAAGKPVIVTSGSWMATQVGRAAGIVIDAAENLADGLRTLAREFETLSAEARAAQATWLNWSSPDAFVEHLLAAGRPVTKGTDKRASILIVTDAPPAASARRAAEAARAIAASGGQCVLLMLQRTKPEPGLAQRIAATWPVTEIILADASPNGGALLSLATPSSFREAATQVRHAALSAAAGAELRARQFDACLVTASEHLALLEQLNISSKRTIASIDGLAAYAIAAPRGAQPAPDDIALEQELLAGCDSVLLAQSGEAAATPDAVGDRAAPSPPFTRMETLSVEDLVSSKSLVDLIGRAEPQSEDWKEQLTALGRVDLLYVDDDTASARAASRWLMAEVFAPYLRKQGVVLAVAGPIADDPAFRGQDGVLRLGAVKSLRPLFVAAKVALAPSHEQRQNPALVAAVDAGKPLVLRPGSLGLSKKTYPHIASAGDAFAGDALQLVRSRGARIAASAALLKALRAPHVRDATMAWSKALDIAAPPASPKTATPANVAALTASEREPLEWSEDIGLANRMLAAWALNETPEPAALSAFRAATRQPALRDLIVELFDSALSGAGFEDHRPPAEALPLSRARMEGCVGEQVLGLLGDGASSLGLRADASGRANSTIGVARDLPLYVLGVDAAGETVRVPSRVQRFRPIRAPSVRGLNDAEPFVAENSTGPRLWPARITATLPSRTSLWVLQPLSFEMPAMLDDPAAARPPSSLRLQFHGPHLVGGASARLFLLFVADDARAAPAGLQVHWNGEASTPKPIGGFGAAAWIVSAPANWSTRHDQEIGGVVDFDLGARSVAGMANAPLLGYVVAQMQPITRPSMLGQQPDQQAI